MCVTLACIIERGKKYIQTMRIDILFYLKKSSNLMVLSITLYDPIYMEDKFIAFLDNNM